MARFCLLVRGSFTPFVRGSFTPFCTQLVYAILYSARLHHIVHGSFLPLFHVARFCHFVIWLFFTSVPGYLLYLFILCQNAAACCHFNELTYTVLPVCSCCPQSHDVWGTRGEGLQVRPSFDVRRTGSQCPGVSSCDYQDFGKWLGQAVPSVVHYILSVWHCRVGYPT